MTYQDRLSKYALSLLEDLGKFSPEELIVYAMKAAILATGEMLLPNGHLESTIDRKQLLEDVTKHLMGGSK